MFNLTFSSVSELHRWLENKNYECESSEAFESWMNEFFENGNTISVHGEEWDYWACWELL